MTTPEPQRKVELPALLQKLDSSLLSFNAFIGVTVGYMCLSAYNSSRLAISDLSNQRHYGSQIECRSEWSASSTGAQASRLLPRRCRRFASETLALQSANQLHEAALGRLL